MRKPSPRRAVAQVALLIAIGLVAGFASGKILKSSQKSTSAIGDVTVEINIPSPDVCPNLPGIQPTVPSGMLQDPSGNCYTPYDACPNIPGAQASVPSGMLTDTNGNCYTPTPEPPQPIDLCNNIGGVQAVVPSGYYRTSGGACYIQPPAPAPPVDVCPNLEGLQETVPEDYVLNSETNECDPVEPPVPPTSGDVCLNIPGVQTSVPSGMKNDNGRCYTPAPITPAPVQPETPARTPLKNVPSFLQPISQTIVEIVPENVRGFFRELPEEIVGQLPLYVFIIILIFILIPLIQSIREYFYKRRLIAFYRRERNIAEEKDNFITLASHYLRTPITIMKDSLSLMQSTGEITLETSAQMTGALNTLGDRISVSLDAANMDPALKNPVDTAIQPTPFWRSGFFWFPIALSVALTIIVNFLIGVVGDKEIGVPNALFQIFIIAAFVVALYLIVRNYHIQKKLSEEEDALIAREQSIDTVRNDFISQQAANISTAIGALLLASPSTPASKPYALYADGFSRLRGVHDKFMLLSHIKTGANRVASSFNLRSIIDQTVAAEQPDIAAKQLTVNSSVSNITLTQNEPLFAFVISSVIDNAIKFSNPGGQIVISDRPENKTLFVKVSDNGRGIDPAKLDQLFKPFSRAESAVDFSYEGLGLSLFFNRLILTYTGGGISAAPRSGGGTDITISTPTDVSTLSV